MTPDSIDQYLDRLRSELQRRGHEDPRLIDEVREHLADAIDEGLRRGLTSEEAEREAFERFGPPGVVARSTIEEKRGMRNWGRAAMGTLWRWKWWLIAPTIVAAATTSAISFFFLPTRYQSETVIQVLSPAKSAADTTSGSPAAHERLRQLAEEALTRAQLEQLIQDLDLYANERTREPLGDVVTRMRRDIAVTFFTKDHDPAVGPEGRFVVSFESPNPRLAMQTTARLAALLVEQNLRERELSVNTTSQYLDDQVGSLRQRLEAQETELTRARTSGQSIREADVLAYEVLRDMYKTALVRREEARSIESLERRAGGFQFRVTEPARLPDRPVGPSHLGVNAVGSLAGLGVGVLLVGIRGRSTTTV